MRHALLTILVVAALTACGGSDEKTPPAAPEPAVSSSEAGPSAGETAVSPVETGPSAAPAPTATLTPAPTATPGSEIVRFRDGGGRGPYVFDPSEFRFRAGDSVNFELMPGATFHTFTVEELGIDVAVSSGETVNFDFTFDAPGTYTLICIPHQALGMVGTITVEAAVSRVETESPQISSDPASLLGSSGTIDDALRPALEDALNVELKLDDTFEMTPAGGYTVMFNYLVEGELPSDPVSAFEEAVGGLGGFGGGPGVTRGGVVTVNYRGISIDDVAFFVGLVLEGKELGVVVSAMREGDAVR